MAAAHDPRLEEIQKIVQQRGVEFFFAQFVDMYGRPSAKLIPAANLDDLVKEGAGFAGFAAGEIGQVPSDRTTRSRTATPTRSSSRTASPSRRK